MNPHEQISKTEAFFWGVKSIAPLLVGVFPFAAIAGISMVDVGIDPLPAMAMSVLVYAGASQIAIADLVGKGAPFLVIVLTAITINLRFVMYSASIAPLFRKTPKSGKWILAYMLTDHAYALSMSKYSRSPENSHKKDSEKVWFYTGCAVFMWITWQIGTILGVYLGLQVPASWALGFAIPLSFLALLVPNMKDLASTAAALTSGLISVAGLDLPLNTGVVAASVCGILAGFAIETVQEKRGARHGN